MSDIEDELFLMTNLYPRSTGLPMVIWVGPSYGAHDIRIKVSQAHGQRMDPRDLAVVALRPTPHVVAGQLSATDLRSVSQWMALNEKAIIDHWNGLPTACSSDSNCSRCRRRSRHEAAPRAAN